MATRPRAAASWATTVTPGRSRSASSKSSKPTSATGSPPARIRTRVTVTRLLPAKSAVTGSRSVSIRWAAVVTLSGVVEPSETQDSDTGRPASAMAAS